MARLESERVVVSAPLSFAGSARRIANVGWGDRTLLVRLLVGWWAVPIAVGMAWGAVVCWYLIFGIFVVPSRLVRRGSRKRRREEARHRETLDAARREPGE